jgi:hypothetical protein
MAATQEANFQSVITEAAVMERPSPQAASAALRLRLLAPHRDMVAFHDCPGCKRKFSAKQWMTHVVGCTALHGFNSSSRHAMVKLTVNDVLRKRSGLSVDDKEPREVCGFECVGCHAFFTTEADASHHMRTCQAIAPAQKKLDPRPRITGPDGRVLLPTKDAKTGHFDTTPVVYDLTIVSPDAPSYVSQGPDAAMKRRIAEKNGLYQERVLKNKEAWLVFGCTSYGAIHKEAKSFLEKAAKASEGRTTAKELCSAISCSVAMMTGHVLFAAERRAGVVHTQPQAAQIPQSRGKVNNDIAW